MPSSPHLKFVMPQSVISLATEMVDRQAKQISNHDRSGSPIFINGVYQPNTHWGLDLGISDRKAEEKGRIQKTYGQQQRA